MSSQQKVCGDPSVYCPAGSAAPVLASLGYFTYHADLGQSPGSETIRTSQAICQPPFYCENGFSIPCAAGTYGNTTGLSSSQCSGLCLPGFFCPEGSISPTERACGNATFFCPMGAREPSTVQTGYYSGTFPE